MRYKNAQDILPDHLLKELQKYASGETIYVPNATGKKQWGEASGARRYYRERNQQIRTRYQNGQSVEDLAEAYGLSTDSIRKILY